MKHCKMCGCIIENGVNGCAFYDTCNTCQPVNYPPARQNNGRISANDDALNYLESRCLDDGE